MTRADLEHWVSRTIQASVTGPLSNDRVVAMTLNVVDELAGRGALIDLEPTRMHPEPNVGHGRRIVK